MEQFYHLIVEPTTTAVPVTDRSIDWVADWCRGKIAKQTDPLTRTERVVGVNVVTQHGVKLAQWGYFVVKKSNGDFKVYDPHYFASKYAPMFVCASCATQRCDQALGIRGCICCHKRHRL